MKFQNILMFLTVCSSASVWAAEEEPADRFFRDRVAPIFARHCLGCHNSELRKGELNLETAEDLLESGYVDPGKPGTSHLLEILIPDPDGKVRMPKDADALPVADRKIILDWIQSGAVWPKGARIEKRFVANLDWWSLQPLQRPSIPTVARSRIHSSKNPVDAFILQRLQEQGLDFAVEADRRTLIRRVYFDLVGLPPRPDEIERFLADDRPLAYERLVDRLLASPGYGERWARHWLDIVHYADTHGYDKDKLRQNAWPYRDYVIRALNEDRNYSRFVREQVAGDAFFPGTPEGIEATGFLAAGPWDFIGHAEVPETKIDGLVARNLDRDDMVSTVMNTFVSTTVQCARCHDHKFDPVSQQHYYSLQAVFASIDRADRPYDRDPQVAIQRVELARMRQTLQLEVDEVGKLVESSLSKEFRGVRDRLSELRRRQAKEHLEIARSANFGYHSAVARSATDEKWVQLDLGAVRPLQSIILYGANEYGWADFGFPEAYRIDISDRADFSQFRTLRSGTADADHRPGAAPVLIEATGHEARFIRVTATRLWERRRVGEAGGGDWIFALGELLVLGPESQWAVQQVQALDSIEAMPRWGRRNLSDGVLGINTSEGSIPSEAADSPSNGYHSPFADQADTTHWVQLDFESPVPVQEIRIWPAFPTDWKDSPGFGFPVRFRIETTSDGKDVKPVKRFEALPSGFTNPGLRPVRVEVGGTRVHRIRLTADRLWDRGGGMFALALAELQVISNGSPIQSVARVSTSGSIDQGRWNSRFLVDGHLSRRANFQRSSVISTADDNPDLVEIQRLEKRRTLLWARDVPGSLREQQEMLLDRIAEVDRKVKTLPAQQMVYSGMVHSGNGAFRGRGGLGPRDIRILIRGDVQRPGESVRAGTIPVLSESDWQFDVAPGAEESERRMALAMWLTEHANPLTWRSIVNRVWQYHFGRAIVDSPNDFGRMGQLPSHPELLDWLAVEFRDEGQSLKRLHRLILTSRTYRQAVVQDSDSASIDAENRLLWRMNRRRLEAELVRDSMLAASGQLDRRMYGPGFRDFVLEKPEHSPHYEYGKFDPAIPDSHRRATYRFLVRSQQEPFMETLDCADPSQRVARRNETVTALQALTLLNNKLILYASEQFAERLKREHASLEDQIGSACQLTLGRRPDSQEQSALVEYARNHGLTGACRLLFNLNEFVFID